MPDAPPLDPGCATLFGEYLLGIRNRLRLTLAQVEDRSLRYGFIVTRAWLSRCENGMHLPDFKRLRVLAHVYDADFRVMVEQMLLVIDMDDTPAASFEGLSRQELGELGRRFTHEGRLREACRAFVEERQRFASDEPERNASTGTAPELSIAFVLGEMGYFNLASSQLSFALRDNTIPARQKPIALTQLAWFEYNKGCFDIARVMIDGLLARMEGLESWQQADIHLLSGGLQYRRGEHIRALSSFQAARNIYVAAHDRRNEASVHHNEALVHLARSSFERAQKAARIATELASEPNLPKALCLYRATLAKAEIKLGRCAIAEHLIDESMLMAEASRLWDVQFTNWFSRWLIYSRGSGEISARRCLRARREMNRLLPNTTPFLEEVVEFKRLELEERS